MGCACTKRGELAMVGFKNPATVVLKPGTAGYVSHTAHVKITTLTVNQAPPNIYLGALGGKLLHKKVTYRVNDYRTILQDLRSQFFLFLDQRTVLQHDRGRPVSASYRKALDWKFYERFESEFAAELYRRRHETISREELAEMCEAFIQRAHVTLKVERLQNNDQVDKRQYVGNILVIPSNSSSTALSNNTELNMNINVSRDRHGENTSDSSSSSSSSSGEGDIKVSDPVVILAHTEKQSKRRSRRRSSGSGSSSSSHSRSGSGTPTRSRSRSNSSSRSRSSSSSKLNDSRTNEQNEEYITPEPILNFDTNLNAVFHRVVDGGISADEYILLLFLYTQALEELRKRPRDQDNSDIVDNLERNFEEKRKIIINKREEEKRKREEEERVPDTEGYSQTVDKELKENESKLVKNIKVGTGDNNEVFDSDFDYDNRSQYEIYLQDFINQQTALIKKLESEREEEIKRLEAELAAAQPGQTNRDSDEHKDTSKDDIIKKGEQKQIAKKLKKIYHKLETAVLENTEDAKTIKKKVKKARKNIKKTLEEIDSERVKRQQAEEKEREPHRYKPGTVGLREIRRYKKQDKDVYFEDDSIGHVEETEEYSKMAEKELIQDEELLLDQIEQIKMVGGDEMEKRQLIRDYFDSQNKMMQQLETERKDLIDQTERNLIDSRVEDLKLDCLKDISENLSDEERIRNILENHRIQHKQMAKDIDANRTRQRERLKERQRKMREKEGTADEMKNETDVFDFIRASDDYANDIDYELEQEHSKLMEQLRKINGSDSNSEEQRRDLLKHYLDNLANQFKHTDADRQTIVNDIENNLTPDMLLIDDLNNDVMKEIEENSSDFDADIVRQKLEEHRKRQRQLLEDIDADRIQRKGILAQKILQRKNKRNAIPMDTTPASADPEYINTVDQELKRDEDELLKFLTKDVATMDKEGRQEVIAKRLEEHVGRQKEVVDRLEDKRREKIRGEEKESTVDVPSKLEEINSWFKKSLSKANPSSDPNVEDKLEDFRRRQRKLVEDVDSSRLQHKKLLQEKLKKMREEKEINKADDAGINTDDLVHDIATMAGTNEEMNTEDIEFVKEIYKQKEHNEISEDELQRRLSEHFSKARKMKELIDEEGKTTKNKMLERKESIRKKREEEAERQRMQEEQDKRTQEENEEEQRKALSRAYRNNELVKSTSLIRKHQADHARMTLVVEESKSKVKDKIREKKKKKHYNYEQDNEYSGDEVF